MHHVFQLHPNINVLTKYGYVYVYPLELEVIWTEKQRLALENLLTLLLDKYGLIKPHDTLLYIILVEHNHADCLLQQYYNAYANDQRLKQFAQLLLMLNPTQKHKPNQLKLQSATDDMKITDDRLLNWLTNLVNHAMLELDFNPSELGLETLDFLISDKGLINDSTHSIDYTKLERYANRKFRKPTIRERNSVLAPFLLKVLEFLNKETKLSAPEGIRFTDKQLIFLYELSKSLEWINDLAIGSDGKDYMSTLLLNYLNK